MVYLPVELYEDLQAGSFRFGQPMTVIMEELVAQWAVKNRAALDEARKGLQLARGGSSKP